jgi:hypothetical protein
VSSFEPSRPAWALREFVVLTIVTFFSATLFLPAVQNAKQNEAKNKCASNLKQIVLATHNCHDTYSKFPPLVGAFPNDKGYGTVFYYILPMLEQDILYRCGEREKGHFSVWNNDVYGKVVKTFLCPADSSGGADHLHDGWLALSSYAANFQIFGDRIGNTMQGSSQMADIRDGTAFTILFAERYQTCNGTPLGWAYGGESTSAPAFAYLSAGKFQDQPAQKDCDPTLAQGIHAGGIQVALADASVRFVSSNISPQTWWLAVVPDDGMPLGNDW